MGKINKNANLYKEVTFKNGNKSLRLLAKARIENWSRAALAKYFHSQMGESKDKAEMADSLAKKMLYFYPTPIFIPKNGNHMSKVIRPAIKRRNIRLHSKK